MTPSSSPGNNARSTGFIIEHGRQALTKACTHTRIGLHSKLEHLAWSETTLEQLGVESDDMADFHSAAQPPVHECCAAQSLGANGDMFTFLHMAWPGLGPPAPHSCLILCCLAPDLTAYCCSAYILLLLMKFSVGSSRLAAWQRSTGQACGASEIKRKCLCGLPEQGGDTLSS